MGPVSPSPTRTAAAVPLPMSPPNDDVAAGYTRIPRPVKE
jgi:hypothetical protein